MHRCKWMLGFVGLVVAGACGPGTPADTDATSGSTATTGAEPSSEGASETESTESPTSGPGTTGTTGPTPTTSVEPETATSSTTDDPGTTTTGGPDGLAACGFAESTVRGLVGQAFVAGDFDQDGAIDLVVKPDGGTAQIHFNGGNGAAFTAGLVHDIANGGQMAGGDFDGDGRVDVVHYDFTIADELQVQLNIGGELAPPLSTPSDALYYTFRVADVDGDGDSDVSLGGRHSEPVDVLLADGGALTATHQLQVSACYATGSDWADFDGDGDLDFAVVGDCNAVLGMPPIAMHLREGDGYVALPDVGLAESSDPPVLVAGDYDGDGVVDLVTQGHHQTPHFNRHLGVGDATFAALEPFEVPDDRWIRQALDADADGRTDLLADGDGLVVLYRSTGSGFEPCLVGAGVLAAAADFDGDGRLDVMLKEGPSFTLARGQ
ncbi:Repeat domain-containing protein [Nannocystis exedens]|uniref:Repeat domain-containing protein n=1 Tax=Nannocystis exedens TaxID=54 RepID=A0A1I2GSX7_9BACT|nr:VCBS repeat-containing protein [Nannocystis exedens]PCC68795.1 FG-GAP repeat protein [Nannocystis exedens]SFF20149.1 Repeat domain-containing protein [Nannocystis exedens]